MHKGVKCLDVSTGRVYISRDVVFDENLFPFSDLHPNAGRRLKEDILLLPSSSHVDAQNTVDHMSPIVPISDAVQVVDLAEQNPGENIEEHAAENNAENHDAGAESEEEHSSLSDPEVDFSDPEADPASPRASPDPEADPVGTRLSSPRVPTPPSSPRASTPPSDRVRPLLHLPHGVAGLGSAPLSGKMLILRVPALPDLLRRLILQQMTLKIVTMLITLLLLLLYNLHRRLALVSNKV
jgi:hypothetical protein